MFRLEFALVLTLALPPSSLCFKSAAGKVPPPSLVAGPSEAQLQIAGRKPGSDQLSLTQAQASHFAQLALKCIRKEYPNKPEHVINAQSDVLSPRVLHPAFYGCYDWHSSVHGHWMLVRLLRLFPSFPEAQEIRADLNANLNADSIAVEVAYLKQPNRQSFERTYGWAWLLKLAEELHSWNDTDGKMWSRNLQPLADALVNQYIFFMPKQTYPIRTGVHPNTAFDLAFAMDYAQAVGNQKLASLICLGAGWRRLLFARADGGGSNAASDESGGVSALVPWFSSAAYQ